MLRPARASFSILLALIAVTATWGCLVSPASSNEQPSHRASAPDRQPHPDRSLALQKRNPQCNQMAPLCQDTCRSNAARDCFINCMHDHGC